MLLLVLAYLGGVLTLLSPCILPVLPFVFARADRPFLRSGLPLLIGMALMFAVVASLAAVGSEWVAQANQVGRWIALAVMALFALALLWPALADRLLAPFQRAGARLSARADAASDAGRGGVGTSLLIGVATGLLWAPCAGPILGLILTGAALQGASVGTSGLLLAYALGAATSLALALWVGGRVFTALKQRLGTAEWIRRGLGVAALLAVVAIAMGWDTGVLTRLSTVSTARLEQGLLNRLPVQEDDAPAGGAMMMSAAHADAGALPVEGELPSLAGATGWLNSPPLDAPALRGKVVLVDFWTYSCINCLRALPHVREWAERYRDHGLVVIGVHAPEFAFERNLGNVQRAVKDLKVDYPVAIDNDFSIWRGFNNRYWPAHYFIDAQGRIRAHHFGEGNYAQSEQVIRQLLREAGHTLPDEAPSDARAMAALREGVERQADMGSLKSPETYLGHARAENFASPGGQQPDTYADYTVPDTLALNQWALGGRWVVGDEDARLEQTGGRIAFRFHARDLHLVLSPGADGKPVRYRVRIDGQPPGDAAGGDTAADGSGQVDGNRLYQLIRQSGPVRERTFEIEFLDPGVHAYAFTFG
jgi:cytochrome c biogenesis protein CcdA/thiol-disulfide isomerase/thioredoxin